MTNVIRVALPGYDALTDTNLDHFSLYSDVDNVLIKRLLFGTATIADGSPTILTIPHNLGYIPFFLVYFDSASNGNWSILNNQYGIATVPEAIAAADTTNLYIYNFGGHASGNLPVAYEIFYDNMNDDTAPSITENEHVIKVARPGENALTSKNPNDYIMHSDLNNYKILSHGTLDMDWSAATSYTIPHGATISSPYKYIIFLKSPRDGKTIILGGNAMTRTYNEDSRLFGSTIDATNIYLTFPLQVAGSMMSASWYIFGTGVSGTIPASDMVLAVAKSGSNVLTETNPDNFNFHSSLATLKYFTSDTYDMGSITDTTEVTIAHNLGYVPFFIVFVKDLAAIISNGYALVPYYFSRSSIPSPSRDVAAWAYADETNIYLKAYYQTNAIGTAFTFTWYYKIFKNNLGL